MAVPYESFDLLKLGLSKIKNNKNYDYEQQKNLIFQSKIE